MPMRPMDFAYKTIKCGVDTSVCCFFGGSHQQAIVSDVGAENGRESAPYSSAPSVRSEWTFGRLCHHCLRRFRTND